MGFRARLSEWRRRLAYLYLAVLIAVVGYGVANYLVVVGEYWSNWFTGTSIDPLDDSLFKPVTIVKVEVVGGYLNVTFLRTHVKPYVRELEIIVKLHIVDGRVVVFREWRRVASGQLFERYYYVERLGELYGRIVRVEFMVDIEGEILPVGVVELEEGES